MNRLLNAGTGMFAFWVTVATALMAQNLLAQNPNGGLKIAKVTGKVAAVAGNRIKITSNQKDEFFAIVDNKTKLHFSGKAEPSFLVPGVSVRFDAEINPATGVVKNPVSKLQIFTPSMNARMDAEQMREQTPGVYLNDEESEKPAAGKKANANPKNAPAKDDNKPVADKNAKNNNVAKPGKKASSADYHVVGTIGNVQGEKYWLQAGNAQIQFSLSPKAEITVQSTDPSLIQIGDEANVSGLSMSGQEQFIQCESVEIIGAKPLNIPEPKVDAKGRNSKNNKGKNDKSPKGKDDGPKGKDDKSKKPSDRGDNGKDDQDAPNNKNSTKQTGNRT